MPCTEQMPEIMRPDLNVYARAIPTELSLTNAASLPPKTKPKG
ncbi:MAG: hypothetical protein ACI9BH_001937 [Paracoccaceae bacterium]|jgi:hypothetical protein